MRKTINIPPPANFASYSPSELFKFFFQIGHWTEESFSGALQAFTRGKLVSTVTISKWKNRDVIPTRYSGAFLRLIKAMAEPALANDWIAAFETVWALHTAGRTESKPQAQTENFDDQICDQHRNWINEIYHEKRPGERFSVSDIYVPIQLSDDTISGSPPLDIEDILDERQDWNFIVGGPGAGKSMAALHLANTLCQGDVFPIYIRGTHLSNIDIDITDPDQSIGDTFSIKSFLKHFRASSFSRACLILDGLDEINRASQGSVHALLQLISDLTRERAACAAHGKALQIIVLGRQAHIEFAEEHLSSGSSMRFALRALDGSSRTETSLTQLLQGHDLRCVWWEKYLSGNGYIEDPSLPDFLSTEYDDFFEFGGDPLLSYLICHASLKNQINNGSQISPDAQLPHERVNAFTYTANKNEIYQTLITHQARSVRHLFDGKQFLSVLQNMALAVWHSGSGRAVSLREIYAKIHRPDVRAAFQALNLVDAPSQTPPELLVTAFYYRLTQDESASEQGVIEFTHKTFAEYLVGTLLFDSFTALLTAYGKDIDFETALENWMQVSCEGAHSPGLADFCQNEAAIRFEAMSDVNWDAALTIIRDHFHRASSGNTLSQIQKASSLLFFLWSSLNLARQKRTGTRAQLSDDSPQFNTADLKLIQRPNGLSLQGASLVEPLLRDLTFLTPSLSALHLRCGDMSQMSFSLGHIENLSCEDTSFAMTHWSHVKITTATFDRTLFQQAIFHQWRVLETHLSQCLFQGSRFQGAIFSDCVLKDTLFSQCHFTDAEFLSTQFENVTFDRCVFSRSVFSPDSETDRPFGAQFWHCTFLGMDRALKTIPSENITTTISDIETENLETETKVLDLETVLKALI